MGGGESLVEVDVHDIEAHVAGTGHAEHRVEVGSVVVEQGARIVDKLLDCRNLTLEYAESVGVGHHHRRHRVIEQRGEGIDIDRAVGERFHRHHAETGYSGRGGIGAVGRVGDYHLGAFEIVARVVVGTNNHQAGKFAVGTGIGVESELAHASDF